MSVIERTRSRCADQAGVAATWSADATRDKAPQPIRRVGATPLWDAEEVRQRHATRPIAVSEAGVRTAVAGRG